MCFGLLYPGHRFPFVVMTTEHHDHDIIDVVISKTPVAV